MERNAPDSGPFTTEVTLLIPDTGTWSVMKEGDWLLKGFSTVKVKVQSEGKSDIA